MTATLQNNVIFLESDNYRIALIITQDNKILSIDQRVIGEVQDDVVYVGLECGFLKFPYTDKCPVKTIIGDDPNTDKMYNSQHEFTKIEEGQVKYDLPLSS